VALDQPSYGRFFTTGNGSTSLSSSSERESWQEESQPAAYFPRGFSNNIRGLVARVDHRDGRGGNEEGARARRWAILLARVLPLLGCRPGLPDPARRPTFDGQRAVSPIA
jgi:hypothetical protein